MICGEEARNPGVSLHEFHVWERRGGLGYCLWPALFRAQHGMRHHQRTVLVLYKIQVWM